MREVQMKCGISGGDALNSLQIHSRCPDDSIGRRERAWRNSPAELSSDVAIFRPRCGKVCRGLFFIRHSFSGSSKSVDEQVNKTISHRRTCRMLLPGRRHRRRRKRCIIPEEERVARKNGVSNRGLELSHEATLWPKGGQ